MYPHPGVYIKHVASNKLSVEAASTSVAAFIGPVNRGVAVTATQGEPEYITSQTDYARSFGPLTGGSGGIRNEGQEADVFGHAIAQFFANGGAKAYVVPIAGSAGLGTASQVSLTVSDGAETDPQNYTLTLTATSPGTWADDLLIAVTREDTDDFTLTIGTLSAEDRAIYDAEPDEAEKADLLDEMDFNLVLEQFTDLSLDPADGLSVTGQVNGASLLFTVASSDPSAAAADDPTGARAFSDGGVDATAPADADYGAALDRLRDYRTVSTLVLPGLTWAGTDIPKYQLAIAHAEFMQNRMVLIDTSNPKANADQLKTPVDVKSAGFPVSPYTALYYPYVTVGNPFYDADTAANLPPTFDIGPSAMAAGLWGRIDTARGVWKAPAGLEATVRGSLGPNVMIGNAIQDNLNGWGVNCIRSIIGPPVVWGARTLATKTKPQYRYVSVRRTQNMIGESLYNALQAVVFEPNDHNLWSGLRASIGDFMDGLHRGGAFQGEKASDAYYVRCNLGTTMTQGDIDAGIVRVVVGFAPLKPAEFVVVEIEQKVNNAA